MDQPGKHTHRRHPKAPSPSAANEPEAHGDQERREKIAKIKKSIEDGTYQVSSEEVARKLIEQMLEPRD